MIETMLFIGLFLIIAFQGALICLCILKVNRLDAKLAEHFALDGRYEYIGSGDGPDTPTIHRKEWEWKDKFSGGES